jgi:hypothetical protein
MADRNNQNGQDAVLNLTDDAVITDPVPPKTSELAMKSFSESSRIFLSDNTFLKIRHDIFPSFTIEVAKLL